MVERVSRNFGAILLKMAKNVRDSVPLIKLNRTQPIDSWSFPKEKTHLAKLQNTRPLAHLHVIEYIRISSFVLCLVPFHEEFRDM